MSAPKSKSVLIRYKRRSVDVRPGDEATVSEETADYLVANGHATRIPIAKSKKD